MIDILTTPFIGSSQERLLLMITPSKFPEVLFSRNSSFILSSVDFHFLELNLFSIKLFSELLTHAMGNM